MKNIMYLKLNNGEHVVGEVVPTYDQPSREHLITIINPLGIDIATDDSGGYMRMSFYDWVPFSFVGTNKFDIKRSDVMVECITSKEMERHYNKMIKRMEKERVNSRNIAETREELEGTYQMGNTKHLIH